MFLVLQIPAFHVPGFLVPRSVPRFPVPCFTDSQNFISASEVVNSVKETVANEKTEKMVDDFFEGVRVTTTNEEQRRPRRSITIPCRFNDFLETEILPNEKTDVQTFKYF